MMPLSAPDFSARGATVLVVEDEAIVAINLESMLEDLGCVVAGPLMHLDKAMKAVAEGLAADAAILDVNLNGQRVFPLARLLTEQRMPIVFASGYGREGLPPEWQSFPVVQKPYTLEQIAGALEAALIAHSAGQISELETRER